MNHKAEFIHKKVGVSQMRLPAVGRECGIRRMVKAESLKTLTLRTF
jgi:hypothetical protein